MSWLEVRVRTPLDHREAVANLLFDLEALGIAENDAPVGVTLSAYYEVGAEAKVREAITHFVTSLAEITPSAGTITVEYHAVQPDNWADRYKEFYKAQKLSHTFFLKPAWDKVSHVPDDMIAIEMDPGQAFGTGLHPSTKITLSMMERAIEEYPSADRIRFLDVGTGSGILSIGAAKLGVMDITAIDIDADSIETAKENCVTNGCTQVRLSTATLQSLKGPFDLIVSNILLETHRELKAEYARLLGKGGILILSGILGNQKKALEVEIRSQGLKLEESQNLQEWAGVMVRSPGK